MDVVDSDGVEESDNVGDCDALAPRDRVLDGVTDVVGDLEGVLLVEEESVAVPVVDAVSELVSEPVGELVPVEVPEEDGV